ncbi:MAG: hypothetical protein AB7F72_06220, partial [Afipia sp.]
QEWPVTPSPPLSALLVQKIFRSDSRQKDRFEMNNNTATKSNTEPFVFFRGDMWYVVEIPRDQVLANVELNPGTTMVQDVSGNVVWRPQ